MSYSIGDRCIVLNNDNYNQFKIGEEIEVIEVLNNTLYSCVSVLNPNIHWFMDNDNMKPVYGIPDNFFDADLFRIV